MKISRLFIIKKAKKFNLVLKKPIVILLTTSILMVPVTLSTPKFVQILIDDVMYKKSFEGFNLIILGLLAIFFTRLIFDAISLYYGNMVLNKFTFSLRKGIWNKCFKIPFSTFEKKETGNLKMQLIDDVDSLGNFVRDQIVDYIYNILMILFSLFLVFTVNIQMTLICISIIPFVFLINNLIGKGARKTNEEIRKVNEEYYTSTHNSLQYWKEIKVQGTEHVFIGRFKAYREILARLGFRNIRYWFYTEVFNDFKANYLTRTLIYIIGTFFVIKGEITVGILMMFAEYFSILFTSLDALNSKNVMLKVNMPYYKRIFETLDLEEENDENKKHYKISGRIKISGLSFKYNNKQKEVLSNINLQIDKGDFISIIGKSGSGKTTLIKLLLGLYQPEVGDIYFDEINLSELSKETLYNDIGVVMQDSYLFNMSIRENLMLANENASADELIAVCKKVNIYEFVKSLSEGFDSIIGEKGVKLSGGQKQRICIAQALLKKPSIIIFDEATNSLDKVSEDIINQSINEISKDVTVIVISHKPSAFLRAKKIVLIDAGKITDYDEHHKVLGRSELYRNFAEVN